MGLLQLSLAAEPPFHLVPGPDFITHLDKDAPPSLQEPQLTGPATVWLREATVSSYANAPTTRSSCTAAQ
jgi:hypothetical protein